MSILLDECLPRQLARELVEEAVRTVAQCGWSSFENGRLGLRVHQLAFVLRLVRERQDEIRKAWAAHFGRRGDQRLAARSQDPDRWSREVHRVRSVPLVPEAPIGAVLDVKLQSPGHLYWPKLDIDLAVDSIDHPERFPLVSKHRPKARSSR